MLRLLPLESLHLSCQKAISGIYRKQFDFRTRNVEQNSDNEKYCKNRLGRIKRASGFLPLYMQKVYPHEFAIESKIEYGST